MRYAAAHELEGTILDRPHRDRSGRDGPLPAARARDARPGCRSAPGASTGRCCDMTRAQTTAYCRERGLTWREDATQRRPRPAGASARCWSCTRPRRRTSCARWRAGGCTSSPSIPGTARLDLPGGLVATSEYGRVTIGPPARIGLPVPGPGRVRRGRGRRARSASSRSPTARSTGWRARSRSAPGARATGCARSAWAARSRCRTCSPTARSRGACARTLPVVVSDGEIAWVPGVATGERFRVQGDDGARTSRL